MSDSPVVLRAGLSGWLIEVGSMEAVHDLTRHLRSHRDADRLPGVLDIVPGARTVLLDGDPPGPDRALVARVVAEWDGAQPVSGAIGPSAGVEVPVDERVEVPVVYDGPDLDDVARLTGLTTDEVVAAHTGTDATVAFCGFVAGFAYITGLPDVLRVPRLDEPRTAVPSGSVGLAAEFTGVYPRRSPGGWRLIGRTALTLWDETRDPPALLTPGTTVRFVPTRP
jgi:KipI family sensor histidine kinase inhibitor